MLRATLKSLLSRKLRVVLSGIAVVLGVMFVSGAFVLTDTISRSFDALFTTVYSNVDVQIVAEDQDGVDFQNTSDTPTIPASVLDQVQEIDGVATATGSVMIDGARAIDPDTGKYIVSVTGVPSLGGNWTGEDDLVELREGHEPRSASEVVINAGLAETGGFEVGDDIELVLPDQVTDDEADQATDQDTDPDTSSSRRQTFTVVGIYGYSGGRGSLSGETTVLFTTPTAQQLLLGAEDVFTEVDIQVTEGASASATRDAVKEALGSGYKVQTGDEAAAEQSESVRDQLSFITYILLGFASIALFVGIFIILNTFSIIVAQRMRELALLRAIGASRRQVLFSVLTEALVIGVIASIVGLAVGVGIGAALAAAAVSFIDGMHLASIGVPATAVVASLVIGIGVTLVAAFIPAIRASRIPPMAALQDAAIPDKPLTRLTIGGSVITGAGAIALFLGLTGRAGDYTLETTFGGVFTTFVGIALLTPLIARPVVTALGKLLAWSVPGELGRRNTARNPRRTAITAAALMVGVALVTAISTIATSTIASTSKLINESFQADLLVYSASGESFESEVLDQGRQLDGVTGIAGLWYDMTRSEDDGTAFVYATDDLPAMLSISGVTDVEGSSGSLAAGEIAVDDGTAEELGLSVGSTLVLGLSRAEDKTFTVTTVYEHNDLLYGIFLSDEDTTAFSERDPVQAYIALAEGTDVDTVKDEIDTLVADYPDIIVIDRSDYLDQTTSSINMILGFIQILLALALIIAVLGVINTLVLSIIERTREIGLLRAVGLSRAQTTRMIMVESIVISLFGALLGVLVGTGLGAAVVRALRDQGMTEIALPYTLMVVYLILAGIVGVIAAVIPAWRASRLNVLNAIAHE